MLLNYYLHVQEREPTLDVHNYCCVKGEYCHCLSKMIYLDHRAFLPSIDMLRSQRRNFPNKEVPQCPPALKTMAFVDASNAELLAETTAKGRSQVTKASGCKGVYSLRRLPSHDRLHNTPVDPMHLLKNIAEHVLKLLSTKLTL